MALSGNLVNRPKLECFIGVAFFAGLSLIVLSLVFALIVSIEPLTENHQNG